MHNLVNFDNAYAEHSFDGTHRVFHRPSDLAVIKIPLYPGQSIATELARFGADGGVLEVQPGFTETITSSITLPNDNIAIICPTCDAVITDGDAAGLLMLDLNGKDYCTVSGIKFVGLGAGKTSIGIGTTVSGPSHNIIEHCWFHDCNYGIYFYNNSPNYNLFDELRFSGHATYAIYLRRSGSYNLFRMCRAYSGAFVSGFVYLDWSANYNTFSHCSVDDCGSAITGFFLGDRGCTGTLLDHCRAYRCRYGFLFYPRYSADYFLEMCSCLAYQNYYHGFYLAGDASPRGNAVILSNCWAIDNSYTNNNTYVGFYITYEDRLSLLNCRGYQIASQQKYGFEITANATKCEVRGGVWAPNQSGSWLDQGTDTHISARDD